MIYNDGIIYTGNGNSVVAIDAETGETIWEEELEGKPLWYQLYDGKLYVNTEDGKLYVLY